MSGGRFLFDLQEIQVFERILSTMSMLKASINIWNEDISPDADDESMWSESVHDLEILAPTSVQVEIITMFPSTGNISSGPFN